MIMMFRWIGLRPQLLAKNPLWIVNNQCTIVFSFHQDFVASMHRNFSQGQTDKGLIYWHDPSGENQLSKQEERLIETVLSIVAQPKEPRQVQTHQLALFSPIVNELHKCLILQVQNDLQCWPHSQTGKDVLQGYTNL